VIAKKEWPRKESLSSRDEAGGEEARGAAWANNGKSVKIAASALHEGMCWFRNRGRLVD